MSAKVQALVGKVRSAGMIAVTVRHLPDGVLLLFDGQYDKFCRVGAYTHTRGST
jgi:hypothetical protein